MLLPVDTPNAEEVPPTVIDAGIDGSEGGNVVADGGKTDAWLVTTPDGRVLQVVDYCPPIYPLPSDLGSSRFDCPASFGEAVQVARSDASPFFWPLLAQCAEGPYVFVQDGLGGNGCYYRQDSQQLFAFVKFTDTLVECGEGLASFTYGVYGERVACTSILPVNFDGGVGEVGGGVEGGSIDAGALDSAAAD